MAALADVEPADYLVKAGSDRDPLFQILQAYYPRESHTLVLCNSYTTLAASRLTTIADYTLIKTGVVLVPFYLNFLGQVKQSTLYEDPTIRPQVDRLLEELPASKFDHTNIRIRYDESIQAQFEELFNRLAVEAFESLDNPRSQAAYSFIFNRPPKR